MPSTRIEVHLADGPIVRGVIDAATALASAVDEALSDDNLDDTRAADVLRTARDDFYRRVGDARTTPQSRETR